MSTNQVFICLVTITNNGSKKVPGKANQVGTTIFTSCCKYYIFNIAKTIIKRKSILAVDI